MDAPRTAGLNAYLPAYLVERLKAYAAAQKSTPSRIVEEWIDGLADDLTATSAPDFTLPHTTPGLTRLPLNVQPEQREALNHHAQRLGVILGGEPVYARRLLRWLIEHRLQALGEL